MSALIDDAFLAGLEELLAACEGCNRHERAIVLIHACIDDGYNTHGKLMRVMAQLDWNLTHAAILLSKSCGPSPARHRWWRDEDGAYHNHP